MPLHVTHSYDPILVDQIVVALYGGPGLGKTTLAFTAESPLCLDFDGGSYRAKNRKDVVRVAKWADVALMQASDVAGYKTVILDTAGRALDKLSEKLIADDPKNANGAGNLSLQGYGALKGSFATWLNRLKGFGVDVVLIAHASEERKGDDIIERLDVQGGSRGEIHKSADAMGRLYVERGERWLTFSPTDAAFGKNPANMAPLVVPHPDKEPAFLALVITEIKRSLNEQSEAVRKMREKIDDARTAFAKLETAEALTAKALELAGAEPAIKAVLLAVAGEKGFTFSREVKAFVKVEAKQPEPSQPPPASTGGLFGGRAPTTDPEPELAGAGAGAGRGRGPRGGGGARRRSS